MTAISRRIMCALAMVCTTVLLPLGALAPQPADAAKPVAKATKAKKAKKKKAKKKKPAASKRAAGTAGEKGPKGDKGDRGEQGPAGPAGPAGSGAAAQSSIVAKTRLAQATSTGDGDTVGLPLTGNTWTSAPDQAEDYVGSLTVNVPRACDPPEEPGPVDMLPPPFGSGGEMWPGYMEFSVFLDKKYLSGGFLDWWENDAGKSVTVPIRFNGSRTLNGDKPTPRTLEIKIFDDCGSPGQSFEVTDARVNVYALR